MYCGEPPRANPRMSPRLLLEPLRERRIRDFHCVVCPSKHSSIAFFWECSPPASGPRPTTRTRLCQGFRRQGLANQRCQCNDSRKSRAGQYMSTPSAGDTCIRTTPRVVTSHDKPWVPSVDLFTLPSSHPLETSAIPTGRALTRIWRSFTHLACSPTSHGSST